MQDDIEQDWTDLEERGESWFFNALFYLHDLGLINWVMARFILYTIMTYYFLTDHNLRNASLMYLRKLAAYKDVKTVPKRPGYREVYYHIREFGRSIFDRFALWMGYRDRYRIRTQGEELFYSHVSKNQGVVLLSFHMGNFYLMRYISMNRDVKLNIVAYWDATPLITNLLKHVDPESQMNVVRVNPDKPQTVLNLKKLIDRGEIIAMLGDRVSPGSSSRPIRVPFLGGITSIPAGPFLIASFLDCPILLTYALRTGRRTYTLHAEMFEENVQISPSNRESELRRLAEKYAKKMEEVCFRAPYQWYNFYDFWEEPQSERDLISDQAIKGKESKR